MTFNEIMFLLLAAGVWYPSFKAREIGGIVAYILLAVTVVCRCCRVSIITTG